MDVRGTWARVWPPLLAAVTVSAVGVPAAVASYRHARTVVARSGDPAMADWLPLSVDGMLLAALVVIWVRRHRGESAGVFPWVAFTAGMVATIGANLAAAEHTPEGFVVALWPPVAFALTLELVALVAHRTAPPAVRVGALVASREVADTAPGERPAPLPHTTPADLPPTGAGLVPAAPAPAPAPTPDTAAPAPREDDDREVGGNDPGTTGTPDDQREPAPADAGDDDRDPAEWARHEGHRTGVIPGWRLIQREFPHLTESRARTAARDAKTTAPLRRVK